MAPPVAKYQVGHGSTDEGFFVMLALLAGISVLSERFDALRDLTLDSHAAS
jgi:hypothetical protein